MNLRHWVILLLLANLAFWAWSAGVLRDLGLGPVVQSEPERLQQQKNPDSVQLGPPLPRTPAPVSEAQHGPAPAPAPTPTLPAPPTPPVPTSATPEPAPVFVCLQAGPYDARQADALRSAAAALPAGSWVVEGGQLPGRWMVYIGRLADSDAVRAKRAELRELGVDTARPGAAFEPGLSLGRYSTEEAAQRALSDLGRKGVRTARVVQERPDTPAYTLRLPRIDERLRAQLSSLPLAGKDLRPCD